MKPNQAGKGKVKKPKKPKTGASGLAEITEERSGFGILPNRDLKKNLGCG